MSTTTYKPKTTEDTTAIDDCLTMAVRDYVYAYVWRHGRKRAAEAFGVSRHTLWRFLRRGHTGRSLPTAVLNAVGGTVEALEAATLKLKRSRPSREHADADPSLSEELEDTLLQICATPLATAKEISLLGRVPTSTLKARLRKLTDLGLVDSVSHRLAALGPRPHRRHFPTKKGIASAATITHGMDHMLKSYPVSRRWFQLLAERLDTVAVLYHTATMIAQAYPHKKPLRVDLYRQGPCDMLITLTDRQAIGIMRQGSMLPTANFRYRIRSIEMLPSNKKHTVTLVLTHSDQASRRAIRTLEDDAHHSRTFVATEEDFLAGDHGSTVWQQCGAGLNNILPVRIEPSLSLATIVPWMDQVLEASEFYQRATGQTPPNPESLYTSHLRASMPEPSEQLNSSLSVQLTAAEKQMLDLLGSWPLCTKKQLSGFMGGVTSRRVNQVLRSLTRRSLVQKEKQRYVLTDNGLRYLARRDRASVGMVLRRWSARRDDEEYGGPSTYHGTSLRVVTSQMEHNDAVTNFAAAVAAEVAGSEAYEVFDLQPTSRSTIGYKHNDTNYVLHPDAAFILGRWGYTRDCLLEFERRAITPKRIRAKLLNYSRYYRSGWSDRDHGGYEPLVLFVFETLKSERSFQRVAAGIVTPPLLTSNNELINRRGVLGDVWRTSGSRPENRVALRTYFPEDKVQLADPRDSCREDADKPKIPSTYVVRPHSGHGGNFVAVSGDSLSPEKSPVYAATDTVR